ncbi:TolC family protein [Candidatus Obscuribacterales bacterium]|nr:TolC family protein [Candidatus Obscuribacterales bacterium]
MFSNSNLSAYRLHALLLAITFSIVPTPSALAAFNEANVGKENRAAIRDTEKPLQTKIPNADSKKPPRYILELRATQTVKPLGEKPVQKVDETLERLAPIDLNGNPRVQPGITEGASQTGTSPGGPSGGSSATADGNAPVGDDLLQLRGVGATGLGAGSLDSTGNYGQSNRRDGGVNLDGSGEDGDDTNVIIERPPITTLIPLKDNLNPFSLDARYIEQVGLRDTLLAATGQNLDIEEGFSRTKISNYRMLAAASEFLPSINSGYSLYGITGDVPTALFGGGSSGSSANAGLPSTIQILNAGFTQNVYQGGRILFGTLEQKHRLRASRAALLGNVNDTLLEATRRYYDLLLNEALLSIRTRAVSISEEQVRINSAQEKAGAATGLDVLQSQAQLASDEQNLVDQQNARRQAAIQLAHVLNTSFAQDLVSRQKHLRKRRLIDNNIPIEKLLEIAIDKRPELKQFEELRLAAKRAIVVAAAPLQPGVTFGGSVFGIAAGGGNFDKIFNLNLGVKWTLGGLGTTALANAQRARWEARQAAIQAKQTFLDVFDQVRSSYNNSLASDKRIDRATVQINAAEEELRIAKKRMEAGIGLNIDVLNAQRDLTQASINKSRAVIDFNVAQAQLLRDIGAISIDGVLRGLKI